MNHRLPTKRKKPGLKTRRSFIALSFSVFIFLGATLGVYGSVSNNAPLSDNSTDISSSNDYVYSNPVNNSQDQSTSSDQNSRVNIVQETRVSTKSSGS